MRNRHAPRVWRWTMIFAWSGLALFAFGCAGKSARTASAPSIFGDPTPPQPEFRAIFVPTAYNLEWPSRPGLHRRVQTDEINAIVSRAKDLNCNVIILQVRAFGDRIYRKTNLKDPYYPEPWAEPLNNTHDPDTRAAPTYDPLSEWINACDEAGLELHAWVNPFRVNTLVKIKQNGADVYLPIIKYQKQLYLDPRSKAVQDYVKAVLTDLLDNYDATYPTANAPVRMAIASAAMSGDGGIDGILYDHNLPPDDGGGGGGGGSALPAPPAHAAGAIRAVRMAGAVHAVGAAAAVVPVMAAAVTTRTSEEARIDWLIKKYKLDETPKVKNDTTVTAPLATFIQGSKALADAHGMKFGISPDPDDTVAQGWLTKEWVHYAIPELYARGSIAAQLKNWLTANSSKAAEKPIVVAGLYTLRVQTPAPNDDVPWAASEIQDQMAEVRSTSVPDRPKAVGEAHYSAGALRLPDQGGPGPIDASLAAKLKAGEYKDQRLVPQFSMGTAGDAPEPPAVSVETRAGNKRFAVWQPGGGRHPRRWAVWVHDGKQWGAMQILPRQQLELPLSGTAKAVRVKAIDRFNRESGFGRWN